MGEAVAERTRTGLRRAALTVGTTFAILAVCGGCLYLIRSGPPDGDCSLRLRFEGRIYRGGGFGDHQRRPRSGPVVGTAESLDCDDEPFGRVRVRAAVGVPSEQAIVLRGYPYLSTRGSVVTKRVPCAGPATFTGRLLYADEEVPGQILRPPYGAVFRARRGTGLPLEGMRWVNVHARVTPRTQDRYTGYRGGDRVRVTTRCRHGRFVVDRMARVPRVPGFS
ncbi:MAG: hypothetical protein ABWX84_06565 [Nocardioides sp.]